jgi:SulP family sulfate permease
VIYGIMNSIMCVPTLYGYASIIFRNPIFAPYTPALSKLVLLSSVVHQLCFTALSTLPFSIGQVQDAGLLFLSKMADTIAVEVWKDGEGDPGAVVSTTVVLLGAATSLTGICLVLLGRFRLARIVGYIPVPVVGGYLAFIGYFCLQAGVALCVSERLDTVSSWSVLIEPSVFALAVPGVITGVVLLATAKKAKSASTLPIVMTVIPATFYAMLWLTDTSIETARSAKWVGKESSSPVSPGDVFALIDFSKVHWHVAPKLAVTWFGMVVVVGFSSVLDVAAISMDMGSALNTDGELITVGVSNFVAGLFGGFTGSYIFSQTIFQYRTRIWTRWIGIIIVIVESTIFLLRADLLSFSPLFFFGATLIYIGFDLLVEWLYDVRHKISTAEFFVLLGTFTSIHVVGIDLGVLVGIILSIVEYTVSNAANRDHHHFVRRVERRSRKVRSLESWRRVQQLCYSGNVVTFELRGVLYFGNCLQLLQKLMRTVGLDEVVFDFNKQHDTPILRRSLPTPDRVPASSSALPPPLRSNKSFGFLPKFVVLDFHSVQTIDSSAVRSISQFMSDCSRNKISVLCGGANARATSLMNKSDLFKDSHKIFESVSSALEFCEQTYIDRIHHDSIPTSSPLSQAINENISEEDPLDPQSLFKLIQHLIGAKHADMAEGALHDYYSVVRLKPGNMLFLEFNVEGEEDEGGEEKVKEEACKWESLSVPKSPGAYVPSSERSESFYVVLGGDILHKKKDVAKDINSGRGSVVGYVDYFTERHRTFCALAGPAGSVVAKFTREKMDLMEKERPSEFAMLERFLLRVSILELASVNDEL